MNWREVEQALEQMARSWGWATDQSSTTGDCVAEMQHISLNLTEIAKELVDRLGRKG